MLSEELLVATIWLERKIHSVEILLFIKPRVEIFNSKFNKNGHLIYNLILLSSFFFEMIDFGQGNQKAYNLPF